MAQVTIDALTQALQSSLTGQEQLVISQQLVTKRLALSDLQAYINGAAGVYSFTTNAAPPANAFDVNKIFRLGVAGLGNVALTLPAASAKIGQSYFFIIPPGMNAGDQFTVNAAAGNTIDNGAPSAVFSVLGIHEILSDGVQWYTR